MRSALYAQVDVCGTLEYLCGFEDIGRSLNMKCKEVLFYGGCSCERQSRGFDVGG